MFSSRTEKLGIGILGLAAVAITVGCSSTPDDNKIVKAVQSQIQTDFAIHGDVKAESAQGVVTLNGHVSSEAERRLAAREAASISGVTQVINNLSVSQAVPAESEPAATAARPSPMAQATAQEPVRHRGPVHHTPKAQPRSDDSVAAAMPAASPAPAAPAPAPQPAPVAVAPPAPTAPPPPPAPVKHTLPSGTVISVRLIDPLDSTRNRVGDTFRTTLNSPIRQDGEVVVPAGANVEGRVIDVSSAGRYSGHSELKLELSKLTFHGEVYPLQTADYDRAGSSRGKGSAETVGGGAALGAIIGAIAGGGKGAAIGTVVGAGAGGAARGAQKGEAVRFPAETVLTFRLQEPVTIVPGKGPSETRTPMAREGQ